jgi:ATP-dependent 26S proteasome regulatory subunit
MSALFWPALGTGKTLSANVIADAVADRLFRVELTPAVHKYIGETEKHLPFGLDWI